MNVVLKRLKSDNIETIGFLWIDQKPFYFTLEDAHHDTKIKHKTRIPAGKYKIKLRTEGTMTGRYTEKYGSGFHKGMLWLQGVPNYSWVYIHTGNEAEDTSGCILVGTGAKVDDGGKRVSSSVKAYKEIYPIVRDAILNGEEVFIHVLDEQV